MSKKTFEEAQKTKHNILAAAHQVFTAQGYAKASLSDIARVANVTRGAIYWHFENKGELLVALLEDKLERLSLMSTLRAAGAPEQRDPLGMLYRWAMLHFQADAENFIISPLSEMLRQVMVLDAAQDTKERLSEFIDNERQMIKMALTRAIAIGQLSSKVNVELAASYIYGTIIGMIMSLRDGLNFAPYQSNKLIIENMFVHLNEMQFPEEVEPREARYV